MDPPVHSVPPEAVELIESRSDVQFYRAAGCEKCRGTGYRGRTCIHEILLPDDRIKGLVAANASVRELREAAIAGGMRTLLACGIEQAARGTTTIEEILRVSTIGPND